MPSKGNPQFFHFHKWERSRSIRFCLVAYVYLKEDSHLAYHYRFRHTGASGTERRHSIHVRKQESQCENSRVTTGASYQARCLSTLEVVYSETARSVLATEGVQPDESSACSLPSSHRVQGVVKSEPPATLKADRKMLEWVLPLGMQPGGKQVLQARLSVDEGQVRVAAIPQTAPAMVRCHLLDSTFSSVEIKVAALAEEGVAPAGRSVVKRCRVQCKQV